MKRLFASLAILAVAPAAFAQTESPVVGEDEYIVYFGFDEAALDAEAQAVIDRAVAAYRSAGGGQIDVRGYTDTEGSSDYNQRLAQRRAEAVVQALTQQGVSSGSISTAAIGEDELLVPTADGNPQAGNRRVEIAFEPPPPPPEPVLMVEQPEPPQPAPQLQPQPQPQPQQADEPGLFGISVGALYGYNLADGDDEDKSSHLAGLNLSANFGLGTIASGQIEQAGFYNFYSEDEGFGGRTALGANVNLGFTDLIPYIGANVGALYGPGIKDDFFYGPEIGLNVGPFSGRVAYDIPFDKGLDEGIIVPTIGLGLRF